MPEQGRSEGLSRKYAIGISGIDTERYEMRMIEFHLPVTSLSLYTKIRHNSPFPRTFGLIGLVDGRSAIVVRGVESKSLDMTREQTIPPDILGDIDLLVVKEDNIGIIYAYTPLLMRKEQLKLIKRKACEAYNALNRELGLL